MDEKGEMSGNKQFELTCSSVGTTKIDSNNSVDSALVPQDLSKLNDESAKQSSLGSEKVGDSVESAETNLQKQSKRELSLSSCHGVNTQRAAVSYLGKANTSYLDRFINSAVVSSALIRMRVYFCSISLT